MAAYRLQKRCDEEAVFVVEGPKMAAEALGIVLDRSSYDFGKPKWHLLEVLKVPSVYRGLRLVYFYDDDREFDVSQELQIEYYD